MKNVFSAQDRIVSAAIKAIFNGIAPSDTICLDCHIHNIN